MTAEQFLQRYADVAEQLARQFRVDEALSDISDEGIRDEETNREIDPRSEETLVGQSAPPEFVPDPRAEASHAQIGRDVIVNALRHGAQAEVYRAYDPALTRIESVDPAGRPGPGHYIRLGGWRSVNTKACR